MAITWDDMRPSKQERIDRALARKAKRFHKAMEDREKLRPRLFTRILFAGLRMMFNYPDGHPDKEYWRTKGWLEGKSNLV
ncbi:MAG: hypothetical protein GX986_11110 [Firmicutes bacterium]|nr:hypothetical protein [Bacillota bacterium]